VTVLEPVRRAEEGSQAEAEPIECEAA
jgi:hypothetical protein